MATSEEHLATCPRALATRPIWSVSSRVGPRTSARGRRGRVSRCRRWPSGGDDDEDGEAAAAAASSSSLRSLEMTGLRYASVFPDPVCDARRRSDPPERIAGIAVA